MSEEPPSAGDLLRALDSAPDDHATRALLVTTLIADGDDDAAREHLAVLLGALPGEAWVLQLAADVSDATGDHLRAAHFRKELRLRNERSDVPWDPTLHPSHPSHHEAAKAPILRLLGAGKAGEAFHVEEAPSRRLADIAGLATIKRTLIAIIEEARGTADALSRNWLGGVLFYGPPSCGKAFCAEVVAGELAATLWSIDMRHSWNVPSFTEVLQQAVDSRTSGPVVLYLENLDGRPAETVTPPHGELAPVLDSAHDAGQVIILGSATYPWAATPAIVRPGRLGRVLLVLPPDPPSRRAFLAERLGDQGIPDDELDWLAAHTEGHSFGDLEQLVQAATVVSQNVGEERMSHASLRRARQSVPPSSAEWLTHAAHHALMNERGGIYDDLLAYFRHRERH